MQAKDFLISNGGSLDPDWFNGDAITLLQGWVDSVPSSGAVEACVYARAYEYLSTRRALLPVMQRDRDKTTQWSDALIRVWSDRAVQYASQCRALTGGPTAGPVVSSWEGKRRCCK